MHISARKCSSESPGSSALIADMKWQGLGTDDRNLLSRPVPSSSRDSVSLAIMLLILTLVSNA